MNAITVLASIKGCHVEVKCDTPNAAHITAQALSAAHPLVPVGIWRGMRNEGGYINGTITTTRDVVRPPETR